MLKNLLILRTPDADDGNGEDETEGNLDTQGAEGGGEGKGEGEDGEGKEDEGEGEDKAKTGLTKDDITDILSRVMPAGESRAAQPQPEKQYTQAEIEQMLNVWKPDASFLKKLGFQEPTAEQLAAVHELRDALIRQANTMSEARMQQLFKEYGGKLDELSAFVSEQRAQATTDAFYKKYPDLKKYEVVVEQVSAKMEESGFKAPTRDKVFEEIQKNTVEVLKQMGVKIEKQQAAQDGKGKSRMAQLAGGGQGGGAGDGKGAGKRKAGMEVFDSEEG